MRLQRPTSPQGKRKRPWLLYAIEDISKACCQKPIVNWKTWSNWSVLMASVNFETYLSQQVSTIEFSLIEVSVLHGLKQGNEVLKQLNKEMNIESVEKLLEETHEAHAYQKVRTLVLSMNQSISLPRK
jgi:hypothetical protein